MKLQMKRTIIFIQNHNLTTYEKDKFLFLQ